MSRILPSGWTSSSLGDFLLPVDSIDPRLLFENVTYIDISAVDSRTRTVQEPRHLNVDALPSRARRIVTAGDILVATVRPYRRSVAIVPELENPVASTGFCVLRPAIGVSGRFLYYLVQSDQFMSGLLPLQRGVSYPAVSDSDVKSQPVAMPPAEEQIRIIAKLDQLLSDLDFGLSETRAALIKSAQLRGILLDEAYSQSLIESGADNKNIAPNTKWPCISLGEVVRSASYGTSTKTTEEATGSLVLRIPNVEQGHIRLESLKYTTDPLKLAPEDELISGDILVVRTNGSINLVGRAALVGENLPRDTYFASYLIRVRLNTDIVEPAWVERFFSTSKARASIEQGAASTSGQHNINLSILRNLQVPVPSLGTQRRVLGELDALMEDINFEEASMKRAIDKAESERARLIEAAIAGELVRQQSNERSAETLLEDARRQYDAKKKENASWAKARRKVKKTSNSSARLSLAEVLRQNTGWRDAQTVYDTWRADKLHSTSLVERFYSDLAVLVEKGAVEVSEKKDDIGRKLGDRVQWRASGTSQS